MSETATFQLFGAETAERLLLDVAANAQTRILRPIMREAAASIAAATKEEAPSDTGLLAAALGSTPVKSYGRALFVTTGVRRGYRRALATTKKGRVRYQGKAASRAAGDGAQFADPEKYLHLVTGGRKALHSTDKVMFSSRTGRFIGRDAAAVAPNPFMARAFDQVAGPVIDQAEATAEHLIDAEIAAHSTHY